MGHWLGLWKAKGRPNRAVDLEEAEEDSMEMVLNAHSQLFWV